MKNKTLSFVKMQGIGNDFILIDDLAKTKSRLSMITPSLARLLCDRRFGIGADQILWLKRPKKKWGKAKKKPHARMEIINADGTGALMCGNGVRAAALYLFDEGVVPSRDILIETLAGLIEVRVMGGRPGRRMMLVNMGAPSHVGSEDGLVVLGRHFRFQAIDVGNPHAVVFVKNVEDVPVEKFGPAIENHARFPKGVNVEFVEVVSDNSLSVRVWERGAGITLACGTGACAAVVAAISSGRVSNAKPVLVNLPGGKLKISWSGPGMGRGRPRAPIMMEGEAAMVFNGEYQLGPR